MRILIQTGGLLGAAAPGAVFAVLLSVAMLGGLATVAHAQGGQIACVVTENGAPARGSMVVEKDGNKIASGSCRRPVAVAPGTYRVTVHLDGALDNPTQSRSTSVAEGKVATEAFDFETGTLEVRIEAKGQPGTGIVAVEKDGRRIGTLGAGVAARLSAGAYRVVIRLGGREQRHDIELRPGQRRLLRAQF